MRGVGIGDIRQGREPDWLITELLQPHHAAAHHTIESYQKHHTTETLVLKCASLLAVASKSYHEQYTIGNQVFQSAPLSAFGNKSY